MNMEISFPNGKKVYARLNGFTIKTDQPKKEGGEGTAPTPFSLFIASIGTCAGYYVLSLCDKRGIPTEKVKINLSTEEKEEMVEKVNLEISIPKDFPEKYRNALVKAVNSCAVKKHLEKPPSINVKVKG
jgi:ribosomal protein S12 methylthiotransferase accessory factor